MVRFFVLLTLSPIEIVRWGVGIICKKMVVSVAPLALTVPDGGLLGLRAIPGLKSETWGTRRFRMEGYWGFVLSQVSKARPGAPGGFGWRVIGVRAIPGLKSET
jgi:hypothetical protein